jgi:uncharacterized DUF497 family protein
MNPELISGFDWDSGNARKNEKHGVSTSEIEEIFLNTPLVMAQDVRHSRSEVREQALGQTDAGRWLHVTFTMREKLIRPISVRDMSKKERAIYAKALEENPPI